MTITTEKKFSFPPIVSSIATSSTAIIVAFIGIVYAAQKVDGASVQQDHGDFAIWITVHEFLKRGHMLYHDVWDHKDPGFFFLSHPFFEAYGIRGLYIFGLLMTASLMLGIFLGTRKLIGTVGAAALAAGATIVYSSMRSFWSTYTENYSVGPLVLGLGLIAYSPLLAGFVIALSSAMKLSVIVIVAILVVATLLRRPFINTSLSPLWRFAAGYALGIAIFSGLFWDKLDLPGWLQIVAFNREYASRRAPSYEWNLWRSLFFSAPITIQRLLILATVSVPLAGLLKIIFRHKEPQAALIPPALVAMASAAGGLCAMMPQYPLSPHHWQFLAGLAVFAASIGMATCIYQIPHRFVRIAAVLMLTLPVLAYARPAIDLTRYGGWQAYYRVAERPAQLRQFLKEIPDKTSFAIYGLNDSRLDFSEAPHSLRLACRFFYQGGMLSPTFYDEIISCLDKAPDIVFLNKTPQTPAFIKGLERVRAEYTLCPPRPCNYEIYGRTPQICESLPGHDSIKLSQ